MISTIVEALVAAARGAEERAKSRRMLTRILAGEEWRTRQGRIELMEIIGFADERGLDVGPLLDAMTAIDFWGLASLDRPIRVHGPRTRALTKLKNRVLG
jgi:hypothetical protein